MIGNITNLEFAKQWYDPKEIHRCINNPPTDSFGHQIPKDTKSLEFAEWLAEQYQLAMIKGMEIMEHNLSKGT